MANQNTAQKEIAKDKRRIGVFATLIFVLLSSVSICCSAQVAIEAISRDQVQASMMSAHRADYGADLLAFAPLNIAYNFEDEVKDDEKRLEGSLNRANDLPNDTPIAVAVVPTAQPLQLLTPTPLSLVTPSVTPSANDPNNEGSTPNVQTPDATPSTPVTDQPTSIPTTAASQTTEPTTEPTIQPTVQPTIEPTTQPTVEPTIQSTTPAPTVEPTTTPPKVTTTATSNPTIEPTTDSSKPTTDPNNTTRKIAFISDIFEVNENQAEAIITVQLNKATNRQVTVNYITNNGTAISNVDYAQTQGTLTFAPNQTEATFAIPIINDTVDEDSETLFLTLSEPSNRVDLGDPSVATLRIIDDDPPPIVRLSQVNYLAYEEREQAYITATLNTPSGQPIQIAYNTTDETAIKNIDYQLPDGFITIPPDSIDETITIPIINDTEVEFDETFTITIVSATNALIGQPNSALVIIRSDDKPTAQFAQDTYNVQEADGQVAITIQLNQAVAQTVTVGYSSTNQTALAGLDYIAKRGQLTFLPGTVSQTFTIALLDDAIQENDKAFAVILEPSSTVILGLPNQTLISVVDDDIAPMVQFNPANYRIYEDQNEAVITVTVNPLSEFAVSVDYETIADTARPGQDYEYVTGRLTFSSRQSEATFTVPLINDELYEPDETLFLTLSNPSNASLGTPPTATLTILNEDGVPTVQFSQDIFIVNELEPYALLTITLNQTPTVTSQVNLTTINNTAIANQDYLPISQTITFAPGEVTQLITVPILQDGAFEINETLFLQLSNPIGLIEGDLAQTTLQIINADAKPFVQLSSSNYDVIENNGTAIITVTLNTIAGVPIVVNYKTANGSAIAGMDYIASTGIITIPTGALFQTISVPLLDDVFVEPTEYFSLTLTEADNARLGAPISTTITIMDDDSYPDIRFSQGIYNVDENVGAIQLTLLLNKPATITGTITISTIDTIPPVSGIQYTPISTTLIVSPGQTQTTFTVPITDDADFNPNGSFVVKIIELTNLIVASPNLALVNIQENDILLVQFDQAIYTGHELTSTVVITAILNDIVIYPVTVTYSTINDSAIANNDYLPQTDLLTFLPGQRSQTITLTIIDDSDTESSEAFFVFLSDPVDVALGTPDSTQITIIDNDIPTVTFANSTIAVNEGAGQAIITLTLDFPATVETRVDYTTVDVSAFAGVDYTTTSGTLIFTPGQITQTINVPLIDNTNIETDRIFELHLSNTTLLNIGTPTFIPITIVDDDQPQVQFTTSSLTINEDIGLATVNVSLTKPSSFTITVDYNSQDGSAVMGNDYTATTGTLIFVPGQISQTITVNITADTDVEVDETFDLILNNPTNATLGTPNITTISIINDDVPLVQFASNTYTINEDAGPVIVEVTLSTSSVNTVTLDYATVFGTATSSDFTSSNGTLIFSPGDTSKTISIPITNDAIVEADETFDVVLSNPTNATLGTPDTTTVTINNDDVTLPTVTFSASSYSVNESAGTILVTVVLNASPSSPVSVDYSTSPQTATGSDYSNTSGTLNFAVGETSKNFAITINDDNVVETDETFAVNLSNPNNATLGTPNSTIVTIVSDDQPTVQFSSSDYIVNENGGSISIQITLDQPPVVPIVVTYTTNDNTASAGTDYTASSGMVTFIPGDTSETVTINILNDSDVDDAEYFTIDLTTASNATISTPSTANVYIIDDDPPLTTPLDYCSALEVNISTDTSNLPTVVIEVELVNNHTTSNISVSGSNMFVYTNAGEVAVGISSGTIVDETVEDHWVFLYDSPSTIILPPLATIVYTASYTVTGTPKMYDDVFGIDIYHETASPANQCKFAKPIASGGPTGTSSVTIDVPTPFQTFSTADSPLFEATPLPGFVDDQGWVLFEIVHVVSGESIYSSVESFGRFCAFTGNGPCGGPSDVSFDWGSLATGVYQLNVTSYHYQGAVVDEIATASQYFIIN